MASVKTVDARNALRQVVLARATAAAGSNTVISQREQAQLDTFLASVAHGLRQQEPGARITINELVEAAMVEADDIWAQVNPPGTRDGVYLSKAEVDAVARQNAALGALTRLAYTEIASPNRDAAITAIKGFFSTYNFEADPQVGGHRLHQGLPGGTRIDARQIFPANRAAIPPAVLASFDFYDRAQSRDWASVSLQRATINGQDVYVVYCTTDGDDGYVEVLSAAGAPLVSARVNADQLVGFDEVFGRARFSPSMVQLDGPATTEGLSIPSERAAAGQIPNNWPGELQVTQGQLPYDIFGRLGALDLPQAAGSPHLEVVAAAFEYLWDESLRHRVQGTTEPFRLGAAEEGTLVVGRFTTPAGVTYDVADWRDIDDGSYTLYFDRTAEGRLKLAIAQYNN